MIYAHGFLGLDLHYTDPAHAQHLITAGYDLGGLGDLGDLDYLDHDLSVV